MVAYTLNVIWSHCADPCTLTGIAPVLRASTSDSISSACQTWCLIFIYRNLISLAVVLYVQPRVYTNLWNGYSLLFCLSRKMCAIKWYGIYAIIIKFRSLCRYLSYVAALFLQAFTINSLKDKVGNRNRSGLEKTIKVDSLMHRLRYSWKSIPLSFSVR